MCSVCLGSALYTVCACVRACTYALSNISTRTSLRPRFAHRVAAAPPSLPLSLSSLSRSLSGKADWFVRLVGWLLWLKQRGAGVWAMYVQLLPQVCVRE